MDRMELTVGLPERDIAYLDEYVEQHPQRCNAETCIDTHPVVTSNTVRVYPLQTLVTADESGLRLDSKAQAEQVRPVDAGRLAHRIGRLTPAARARVDMALRVHLDL